MVRIDKQAHLDHRVVGDGLEYILNNGAELATAT